MRVETIPLFPLQTVLFPQMPLPLHIFEERYKTMIRKCLEEQKEFGVVLIREGAEVGPPAVPQTIGTMARIRAVQELPEGRFYLLSEGTARFRLLDYVTSTEPFLVGIAESVHDLPGDSRSLSSLVADITETFRAYLRSLFVQAGREAPDYDLPETPEEFSFAVASVVQSVVNIDNDRLQELLEMTDTETRLREQKAILEEEMNRLRSRRLSTDGWNDYLSPN
jgi:Lon protease-like protein